MDIKRAGSQPSVKGPTDWFTGMVRIDPLFQSPPPARAGAGKVTESLDGKAVEWMEQVTDAQYGA